MDFDTDAVSRTVSIPKMRSQKLLSVKVAEGQSRGRGDNAGLLLLILTFIHCELQLMVLRRELFVNVLIYLSLTRVAGRK